MTEESIRPDGRELKELREITIEVGNLERADGSSKVQLGKNVAIASVFGPREQHPKFRSKADRAIVNVTYRMATFSVTDYKRSFPSRREKEISKVLSEAFESVVLTKHFPRSAIDVHVQLFQSDGGTRTAAAIAVSAALADAGIPMRDLIGGIASGIYEDQVCLDLSGHEDMKGTGDMPILYAPQLDEISLFQLDGKFTFEQFKDAFYASTEAIKQIVVKIQDALRRKYTKVKEEIGIVEEELVEKTQEEVQTFIQDEFIAVSEPETEETPTFPSDSISVYDPDDVPINKIVEPVMSNTPVEPIVEPVMSNTPVEPIAEPVMSNTPVEPIAEPVISNTPVEPIVEPVMSNTPVEPIVEPVMSNTPVEPITEPVMSNTPVEPVTEDTLKEDVIDSKYDLSLGLRPMGKSKKSETDDILRDIEYTFDEEV